MKYKPEDIANPHCYAFPEKFDELFLRLRKENPVCWAEPEGYKPFWVITKFKDIAEIESKPDIFLCGPQAMLANIETEDFCTKKYGVPYPDRPLSRMDAPDHGEYRKLVRNWFSAENVIKYKERTIEITREVINSMVSLNGQCDFVKDVADIYTIRVIMMILGVPESEAEYMLKLSRGYLAEEDKVANIDNENIGTAQTVEKMNSYFRDVIKDRKLHPKNDLVSIIANAEIFGKPMPEYEQLSLLRVFIMAGSKSTACVLAGVMLAFAQHPEILQKLKSDPKIIPNAAEEIIRWEVPTKHMMRTATIDYEIRGKKIKAGDRVYLSYQSACRDDEVIDDPFTLRIDRTPNRHLAFGTGPHACVGQYLARLNIITMIEQLVPCLEYVELNGKQTYLEGLIVAGIQKLPIKYKIVKKEK